MKILSAAELPKDFFSYRDEEVSDLVREIIQHVKTSGDKALREYSEWFDGVTLETLRYDPERIKAAYKTVAPEAVEALRRAAEHIRRFAEVQRRALADVEVELTPGVFTGQKVQPIGRVGVYAPGGRFPLVSSLLMGGIPARVAGVETLVVCSPPSFQGAIHPAILVAADIIGADEVYAVGGAQAIAAMAYGSESIRPVDKIVGPGNKYVAQAKKEVFGVVGIDLIAGPTEVLIIADDSAQPEILAADLLAQAEHDADASAILVTPSTELAGKVQREVERQLAALKNRQTAAASIGQNGVIVLVDGLAEAVEIANHKAPEHLEVQLARPEEVVPHLKNFGALFVGEHAAEVLGDYSSGINHTLPTNSTARYRGGLSVLDFLKIQSTLRVSAEGFANIGPLAEQLAVTEGLGAHANAIAVRRQLLRG